MSASPWRAMSALYPLLGFLFGVLMGGLLWLNIAALHCTY